jgi:hypothetical protein
MVHADAAMLGRLNRCLRIVAVEFPNVPKYAMNTVTFSFSLKSGFCNPGYGMIGVSRDIRS